MPGSTPELDLPAARLVQLDDQLLRAVADEEPAVQLLAEHQRRRRLADVGHDDVAGAGQVDVVGRMLRAAARIDRAAERLVERELVRLVERDLAVAGEIGRAAEPGDQVVREVRGADAIRFLRRLGFGARRQERVAAHVGGLVDEERRARLAALDARERARRARVEHRDADVGGNLIEPVAQRR